MLQEHGELWITHQHRGTCLPILTDDKLRLPTTAHDYSCITTFTCILMTDVDALFSFIGCTLAVLPSAEMYVITV